MCEQFGTPAQVRFPRWIPSGGDPEVMVHSGGLGLWGTPVSPSGGTVAPAAAFERPGPCLRCVIQRHAEVSARCLFLPIADIGCGAFMMGWTPPDGIDVPKWRC